EGIQAGELTLLRCEEYFDWLLDRGAISTARRHLAYVRAAYRYGVRHQLAEFDPTADVKLPRLPDHEPATYSNDELRQIHAAIRSEREDVAFHLLAFAGLRLGETAALTWANVDLGHWQLRLIGKGGKFRLVPLHPVLLELLRERRQADGEPVIWTPQRRPLASRTLGTAIRQLVDRADVHTAQPSHAFRRTVATVMYEAGIRNPRHRANHGLGTTTDARTPLPPRRQRTDARGDPHPLPQRPDLRAPARAPRAPAGRRSPRDRIRRARAGRRTALPARSTARPQSQLAPPQQAS